MYVCIYVCMCVCIYVRKIYSLMRVKYLAISPLMSVRGDLFYA